MKPLRGTTLACAWALLAVAATHARATATVVPLPAPSAGAQVQVFFSPDDGTDRAIAQAMAQARQRIWIAGYYFTSSTLAKAIDQDTVGFGSMNFTRAGAQQNAENFNLFRRWPQLAGTYAAEFQRLQKESAKYRPGMVFDADGSAEEKP